MKCPECKNTVSDQAKFCNICGYRLKKSDTLSQTTVAEELVNLQNTILAGHKYPSIAALAKVSALKEPATFYKIIEKLIASELDIHLPNILMAKTNHAETLRELLWQTVSQTEDVWLYMKYAEWLWLNNLVPNSAEKTTLAKVADPLLTKQLQKFSLETAA